MIGLILLRNDVFLVNFRIFKICLLFFLSKGDPCTTEGSIDYFWVNSNFIDYFCFKPVIDYMWAKKIEGSTIIFRQLPVLTGNDSSHRKSDKIPRIYDPKTNVLQWSSD